MCCTFKFLDPKQSDFNADPLPQAATDEGIKVLGTTTIENCDDMKTTDPKWTVYKVKPPL